MKREHSVDGCRASIEETVFDAGNRQAGIIRVTRLKRTPTCEGDSEGKCVVAQRDGGERKAGFENCACEAGQAVGGTAGAIGCARRTEEFSRRHRSFEHPRKGRFALDGDGPKHARLMEDFGPIPQ